MKTPPMLAAIALGLGLTGCALTCTEAGCEDGLFLLLPAATGPLTVSLTSPDAGTRTETCSAQCVNMIVRNYSPQLVRISVVWSGGEIERDFTPQYVKVEPNGPECGPTCYQATLRFD